MSKNGSNVNTLSIKARVFNTMRKDFYKKDVTHFSDEEKVRFFNEIFDKTQTAHLELNNYKQKRKAKKVVNDLRVIRGWAPKKRTSLEEYQQMILEKADKEL